MEVIIVVIFMVVVVLVVVRSSSSRSRSSSGSGVSGDKSNSDSSGERPRWTVLHFRHRCFIVSGLEFPRGRCEDITTGTRETARTTAGCVGPTEVRGGDGVE